MGDEPPWLQRARLLLGQKEYPGPSTNPLLRRMAERLGIAPFEDSEPWCTLFVAYCLHSTIPGIKLPRHLMWSRAFAKWGTELQEPRPGAIMVYWRGKSPADDLGHAGFWTRPGASPGYSRILAGNSGDMVREHQMNDKAFLVSIRWPDIPGRP